MVFFFLKYREEHIQQEHSTVTNGTTTNGNHHHNFDTSDSLNESPNFRQVQLNKLLLPHSVQDLFGKCSLITY